ncbi:MAG TPA: Gfo/Idh/MocA family oxidoreductase [Acetobacteraceae bacterium]|nr:Gfo/Idh/MocA family oxidoreductase [Acetobacteraceae bacterium]
MSRFAAIGLDHRHIYDLVEGLLAAGQDCAGYCPVTTDPRVLAGFRKRFPQVPAADRDRLLDDPTIDFVVTAAVPRDRAAVAISAMHRGKDVMVDKPGVTTREQLADVERVVAETECNWSICFGRLLGPSTLKALEIVRTGGIGRVVQVLGLGPHRLNRALRPSWFFERAAYGGIINDIGCHQIDQFLAFADAEDASIVSSTVGEFGTQPGFPDFAELVMETDAVRGYSRIDWFTADGLPTWGDGRLFVLGTEGTIELRKNVDIAGRNGTDHLFLVDKSGTRHIDCAGLPVPYFRNFAADVANRTETAMPQRQVFTVCRLALEAEARATRFVAGAGR